MTTHHARPDAVDADLMIDVDNLHKSYGDLAVVKGVDLQVRRGEVVCIIGPSGSGKTTFLRCLCQLEKHQSGIVRIGGREIGYDRPGGERYHQRERDTAKLRQRIGFVFQSFNLFGHMTALQNVAYGPRRMLKVPREQAVGTAKTLLDRVGLSDKYDHLPRALSGGQQQRVAIARAMAMQPDIILFDEPTSALDSESVSEVLSVMRDLANGGMTMVVVTHEIGFARDVADTIVMMERGIVVESGPCKALLDNPKSERLRQFLRRVTQENQSEPTTASEQPMEGKL